MKSKIGFAFSLIGLGGISEAYGDAKAIIISLTFIGLGALLMYHGMRYEKNNGDSMIVNANVLDRLRFLP